MTVPANRAAAGVLAGYRAAIQDSDRAIRAAGDPEARFIVPVDGNRHTLRWFMAHMTSETARHAGHADILREQLDGTTGNGAFDGCPPGPTVLAGQACYDVGRPEAGCRCRRPRRGGALAVAHVDGL